MKNLFLTKTRWLVTIILLTALGSGNVWGEVWIKVTSAPTSWEGEYLLVNEDANVAWTGVDATSCGASVTISSGKISSKPASAVTLTLATTTGGYSIKINGGTNNGKYIGRSANSNGMDIGTTAVKNTLAYDGNNSCITITGAGGAILRYNNSSDQKRFRYFKSSSYTSQKKIQLYKKYYTVTYNKNGGDGTMTDSNSPYAPNATVTVLTNTFTAPSGKIFDKWNTKANGTGVDFLEGATFTISKDTTFYAQWQSAAPVSPAKAVYLKPNGIWNKDGARFAIYYWKSSDGDANGWLDMSTYCGPNYTVTVPEGYDKFQFCRMDGSTATNNWDNVWNRTPDLDKPTTNDVYTIEYMDGDAYHNSTGSWGTYTCPDPTTIYLNPNSIWDADGARYAAFYWEGDDAHWVDFEAACGAVTAEIPSGYTNIILCRMNGATATNNWSSCWNQTTDQVTTGHNNYVFTISSINGCTDGKSCGAWTAYVTPTYTISYAKGSTTYTGGNTIDGSRSNETKTCGTDFTLPSSAVFSATGYTQTGWSTSDDGTQDYALGGSYQTNAAQTFYPFWTVNSHTLTWNFDGGSSSETAGTDYTAGGSVNYGTTIDYPSNASMSKTGYTFTGWSSSPATMPDANLTITAQWAEESDTYIDNIWNTATQTKTGTYTRPSISDQDDDSQTDCQHLHYHFVGWITKAKYDEGSTIDARTTPTGDLVAGGSVTASGATFYAVWEKEASGSGGANVYTLVEETLSDWSGSYIFTDPDKGHAMSNSLSSGKFGSKTVTPSNNQITSTDGDIIWVVTKGTGDNASKYSVYNASVNQYANNGNSSTSASLSDVAVYLTFTRDEEYGDVAIKGANGRWFSYYSSNSDFRTYNQSSNYGVYLYRNSVSYEDPIATCGVEYTITINKNESSATCTSCGAKVNANATALSNLVAPTWAGHQVDYYMVASADNSTKIAEADGTLASGVTVSGTPWTDANGKWVKGGDATFYVKWKTTQCVITLNNQGATTAGTASVTATYGASTNLTTSIEIPTKNGYEFGGYFTETNGAGTQLVDANGAWLASKTGYTNASKQWQLDATSLELFAKWTIKSYTVTWVVNGTTEATQASVSYGTLYGNLTEEPTVAHNAIKDACGSDRFVGWIWQEYTGEGGTAGSQFEPYKATASTPIDDTHHTFYAMFATENGTAFTLDGEVGSTQDVHVYYTDGTTNYYATGNIGASSTGKINSTTDVTDANTYVFTKTGTGTYTIKKSGDTKYIKYKSSTDLDTQDDPYTWTISDVSSAGLGSWRLQSGTNQRAWICRTDGTPKFGGYSTTGVTVSQTYRDVELGSSNLTDYRTGCCSEKITLTVSDATSGVGGTVTMKWNNADKSSGNQVSTCSAGTLVAKITANPGYSLTAVTISGTNKAITTDPANLATGLPSTSEMTYTVSVQALATGTLTITPTFSQMYTVTYDLDGGETSGSTTTASYLPNTTVTFVTPNPTKSGYNFTGWVVNKAGGGTQSATSTNFSMPSDNVTVVAQWSAKPLSSITVTPTTATVYVGQYVELPVTYDPADILTKGYTLVSTPSWCVTTSSTQTTLKITGGRSGATINEDKTETVSIQANADNTKTASVTVTVKPLPVDHFVDLIHNVSFDDKGASIVNNVLQATYSAPGYATDYSGATAPGCETEHLHLIGWIDSEWADANPKATQSQITSAPGYHVAYEAGMTANNKTYYAVWGHEVVEP